MTEKDRISYYVQPNQFEHDFPKGSKERQKVERQVKQDYIEVLRNNCYQETLNGLYFIFFGLMSVILTFLGYSPKVADSPKFSEPADIPKF